MVNPAKRLERGDVVVIPPGSIEFELLENQDPQSLVVKAVRLHDRVTMPILVDHLQFVRTAQEKES